jgi:hypothetical protein
MMTFLRNKKQIVMILVLLVVAFLMMDLNNRLTELFRLSGQRDTMQTEVVALKRTEQSLQTQLAYATSDAAVQNWAYEEGHKVLPGDNVIIPLPQPGYTPPAPTQFAPTPQKVENWQVWKALFLGDDS